MAYSIRAFVDAVLDDLDSNVFHGDIRIHRYAPWDPEQLRAEVGERHLAVFPAAEAVDEATPLVTAPGGDMLLQMFRVLYWESASDEAERGIVDEAAAGDLIDLLESVRGRFYKTANTFLGEAELVSYLGASLPDRSSSVRWFMLSIRARTSIVST